MIEFENERDLRAHIKVVGVGGGGGNAITTMIKANLQGVDFITANTDAQALTDNLAPVKIHLGERGLGAGADPIKGREAAEQSYERLAQELAGADMVFVTCGLGGGTGTGASPVVATAAKEAGALTVAVVTKPFLFEGAVRGRQADQGLYELHSVVDTLIAIPNDRLLQMVGKGTAMTDAFRLANEVLLNAVQGISDLITVNGMINLDFADVRTTMNDMGMALMGTGRACGENRAMLAAQAAISNPLLEDLSIKGARAVLINITGGPELSLHEVNEAASLIGAEADPNANIIFGSVIEEGAGDEVKVTVIATGLVDPTLERRSSSAARAEAAKVTPLRPAARFELEHHADLTDATLGGAEPMATDELISPYDDEYDVPAFIRRTNRGSTEQVG